jgi:uncharacterized protein YxeA
MKKTLITLIVIAILALLAWYLFNDKNVIIDTNTLTGEMQDTTLEQDESITEDLQMQNEDDQNRDITGDNTTDDIITTQENDLETNPQTDEELIQDIMNEIMESAEQVENQNQ